MSKKENERDIFGLLTRLRESLRWPKKETEPEITEEDSAFSQELSDRLGKHLEAESAQDAEAAMALLCEEMENAVKLSVPLDVEAHIGANWFEAH